MANLGKLLEVAGVNFLPVRKFLQSLLKLPNAYAVGCRINLVSVQRPTFLKTTLLLEGDQPF